MKYKYNREKINLWMGSWEVYIPDHMIKEYRKLRTDLLSIKEPKPSFIGDPIGEAKWKYDHDKSKPTPPVSEDKTVEGKIEPINLGDVIKGVDRDDEPRVLFNSLESKINELVDVINSLREEK